MDLFRCIVLCALFGLAILAEPVHADSITGKAYKKLQETQELLGENRIEEAISLLTELRGEVQEGSLDEALTLQMLGYAEMGAEHFDKAIVHLRDSLATGKLPEKVKYNVGYMVAQLHAAQGEFDEALSFAADWFKTIESPKAAQYMFMANIYAQLKRYEEAIPYAEQAVTIDDEPRETWYQLLTACYFELKDYPAAATTLSQMVARWPAQTSYWEQLASVHIIMEQEQQALAVLRLAFDSGVLEKENSIRSLVRLSVGHGIPEHAARLLLTAMDRGLVPADETFTRMLANAWMAAREDEKAIKAFRDLSLITETGEPLIRVANLYIKATDWFGAEQALRQALDLGGLDEAGKAWVMLGIALCEQKKFGQGFAALKKARAFPNTRSQASRWLRYAEDMRKQVEWQNTFGS